VLILKNVRGLFTIFKLLKEFTLKGREKEKMSKNSWKKYFPYDIPREQQSQAIDIALKVFRDSNKRFVILEAGTGVGKSAIGVTVSRMMKELSTCSEEYEPGAYFLTTQKILQDQYVHDFRSMHSIKSSSNYQCGFHKRNTCQQSQQMLRTADRESKFFKACTINCKYKNEKKKFLESSESVTNFPYFLTEAAYSGKIVPRDFLVVDEAHNIESELSKFIEVTISERFCKQTLKLKWEDHKTSYQAVGWIKKVYYPKAKSQYEFLQKKIEEYGMKDKISEFAKIAKHCDILSGHVKKIEKFLKVYSGQNWVMDKVPGMGRSQRKLTFKPIDVSAFAQEYLFRLGRKVLMMSATILDRETFCESLGITEADVEFLSIPSPFPAKNRPMMYCPVGGMNSKSIQYTLPKLRDAVKMILNEHKGQKGIIHCHTYRIAKYLKQNIKDRRLLIHDATNRDEILQKHINSKSSTVILSPSMGEGVDLKNDLSRFQVICKVPYPFLGDPLIRKRMKKFPNWYSVQTAKMIMQSAGRSVRSESDSAITYILDSDWGNFFQRNKRFFPTYFIEGIRL
jgi:Rad3-related DNA helicase